MSLNFSFNSSIPASNNNPSNDQPLMLQNNISTEGILAVDHVTFNQNSGGTHKQVTLSSKNIPSGQTDPQSVVYSNSGTASAISQLFYANQNGTFLLSALRAFAFCDTNGVIQGGQSLNVTSITRSGSNIFNVVLTTNAVSSNNFLVLASVSDFNQIVTAQITGIGTFNLTFITNGGIAVFPTRCSFIVLQI